MRCFRRWESERFSGRGSLGDEPEDEGDELSRAGNFEKNREGEVLGVCVRDDTGGLSRETGNNGAVTRGISLMGRVWFCPFEGAEKLLEIWFAPSAAAVPDATSPEDGRIGLRKISSAIWEEMLNIVQCKVLSIISGAEMDAYLLSESSFFVSPHRIILKTCGTTLNLLGLPRILDIAANHANMSSVYQCFYSRKSFMFPERQLGPHRDWQQEVQFLDNIFRNGAAYNVGKVNGDHWLLYMTAPGDDIRACCSIPPAIPIPHLENTFPDYTIEILMSDLSPAACDPFFASFSSPETPSSHAQALSKSFGITDIFPPHLTTLDAYSFLPCGYSSNALIKWGEDPFFTSSSHLSNGNEASAVREGYYTIHVTPEEGWSYASFECNVPLPPTRCSSVPDANAIPDLKTLVERVVSIFQPGRITLTLFISSEDNESDESGESPVEAAQRAFRAALCAAPVMGESQKGEAAHLSNGEKRVCKRYRRTDKINYEFGAYDLAFASFELYDKTHK
ncbi:S-adenosylmethionine decarboxylase [Rhodocollybia butyracea]|uniref:S-adenosylmethionine decarboxylase n=1 Tax=Rhodocollybia butyracea TaxID=206335 RepID=A0A9P5PXK7_9AGAR|nr:S-adenosylmethionine decarboxylase [Rhodocollybia butyracea]